MAIKYTDMELALNTLVRGFHSEAKDGSSTLDRTEFRKLVSEHMPTMATSQTVVEDEAYQKLLKEIGVEEGSEVTFENYWNLVEMQAAVDFANPPETKVVSCGCSIA